MRNSVFVYAFAHLVLEKDRFAPPLSQPNHQASCLAVIQNACIDSLAAPGLLGWNECKFGEFSVSKHGSPENIGQILS